MIFLPSLLKTEATEEINHYCCTCKITELNAKGMQTDTNLLDSRQVRKAPGERNQVLATRFKSDWICASEAISLSLSHSWK